MEIEKLFQKVNELTGKYPNLTNSEIRELRIMSNRLSSECSNMIYDLEIEESQ